jgi:phosphoesterase RecJ-like protein
MKEHFQQAKNLINNSNRILLTMHERMDGDDGGALLAMFKHLVGEGKKVSAAIKHGVPHSLAFLPGSTKIVDDIDNTDYDLVVVFGCSELKRTGSLKIENLPVRQAGLKLKIINFDHHPDNKHFGQVNIVDPKKSSVSELVYDFFNSCGWKIDKEIATCLLTGIITDTGSFMHSNTTPSTLETAAELMRKGAQVSKIIKHTFKSKTPQMLKAWGKAIENSFYDVKNKIIYAVMTDQDLNEIGKLPAAAFDGLVETLNTVPEAKFAMFLRQEGDIIKGSLRSDIFKNIDVSQIARSFGGGGHKLAAGFSVVGKLERDSSGKWRVI